LAYSLAAVLAILVFTLLGAVIPQYRILLVGILVGVVILAGLAAFVFADWDT
jgi:hypothetical protein